MVSIQEIRFEFGKVKSALQRGEELTLTYRNKPLARLVPIGQGEVLDTDPALVFGTVPEDLEPMTNEEIDRAIYA